jgi:predicted MFS family arabinose efflux permease
MCQVVLVIGWSMLNVNLVPALVATTGARQRSSALATNSALRGLGTFLGTVTGGLLPGLFAGLLGLTVDATAPYRLGLWCSALLGAAALVPLYLIGQVGSAAAQRQAASRGPLPLPPIVLVMLHVFLSHGGWAACQAFSSAYMDTDLNLSPSSIGVLTGVGQFAAMLAPLLTPRLAARRGNGWLLLLTSVGIAVSMLPMGLIPHWSGAGLGRLGVISLSAMWLTTMQVFQMDLVPSEWHTVAYGAVAMAMGLSYGSVSLAGGYIVTAASYRTLFLLGSVVSLVGVAFIWPVIRSSGPGSEGAAGAAGAA